MVELQRQRATSRERNFIERTKALGGSFSNRGYVRTPIQFRRARQLSILKDDFFARTDPSIFRSITPVLLDRSNEAS